MEPLSEPDSVIPVEAVDEPLDVIVLPAPKGHPIIAWGLIIALVLFEVILHLVGPAGASDEAVDQLTTHLIKFQGRWIVGTADFLGRNDRRLTAQLKELDNGPPERRLRYIVLVGELSGPEEALTQLRQLNQELAEEGTELTPAQRTTRNLLRRLYRDYSQQHFDAPSLTAEDHQLLEHELGWFGELALTPAGSPNAAARADVLLPARLTVIGGSLGFLLLVAVGVGGLFGLILLLAFLCGGRLRTGIRRASHHGGVYAETFALWMLLFMVFSFASVWVAPAAVAKVLLYRLLLISGAMLLSLVALVWPVLRGVPWFEVRREIGLTLGRSGARETLSGFACYAMALPLLVIGAIITVMLTKIPFGLGLLAAAPPNKQMPIHPIMEYLALPGWEVKLVVFFIAAIVAPLVEETMFRGVLYRHLRDSTNGIGRAGSALLSASIVSFIFAVIHPQGLLGVPPLMGLAFAFALVREWRGSLVPTMVAHGFHNGLLVLLTSVMFSS